MGCTRHLKQKGSQDLIGSLQPCWSVVDCWFGSPNSHSILLQFGEVAKLKITLFKCLQGEGTKCKLGRARKLRLRKMHAKKMHLVGEGEVEATCLLLVDRTQV